MRPGDHPEFFRFPAPEGRSRESTIRIDKTGRWLHDGQEVEHPNLRRALATWISRHPDDGRYILTNGYDWTYFTVEDVPFFVRSVRRDGDQLVLELSDGSEEPLRLDETRVTEDGGLLVQTKHQAPGGPYPARFTRAALVDISPFLETNSAGAFVLMGKVLEAGFV